MLVNNENLKIDEVEEQQKVSTFDEKAYKLSNFFLYISTKMSENNRPNVARWAHGQFLKYQKQFMDGR